MAELKQIQIDKYNAQCKNGFKFDFQHYLYHKEKILFKYINFESNQILKASILYYENNHGNTPTLHLHKGSPSGEFYTFSGLGQFITIGEPQKTKRFNLLIDFTKKLTDEYILSLHDKKIISKETIF